MEKLGVIRVRHSMLLAVYTQTKNYLECIDRNYLGETEPYEKTLIEVMRNNMAAMEKVLLDYFDTEGELTT